MNDIPFGLESWAWYFPTCIVTASFGVMNQAGGWLSANNRLVLYLSGKIELAMNQIMTFESGF